MIGLLNAVRGQATLAGSEVARDKLGVVSSYDPARYAAKVIIQPEGIETGWLPVASPMAGDGWGLFAPPSPGEMVAIQWQEGAVDAGYVAGRFFSDADRPTVGSGADRAGCPSGEIWLMHRSGSAVRLLNSGSVEIRAAAGLALTVAGDMVSSAAHWTHTGPLTVTGTLAVSGDSFTHGGVNVGKSHAHSNVQAGSSNSGPPIGGSGTSGGGSSITIPAGVGAAAAAYWDSI